jgi:hypothetical protein
MNSLDSLWLSSLRLRAIHTLHRFAASVLPAVLLLCGGCGKHDVPAAAPQPMASSNGLPHLSGVWSTSKTASLTEGLVPELRIEDHLAICYACTIETYEFMKAWLADPANDERSSAELVQMFPKTGGGNTRISDDMLQPAAAERRRQFDPAEDPGLKCVPFQYPRLQYDDLLPNRIEQFDDRVVFHKEYWNAKVTVHLDGHGFPKDLKPSAMGYSIGWYDGPSLVVVTAGLAPGLLTDDGVSLSVDARIVERFTLSADSKRIRQTISVFDPATFRRPAVFVKTWLSTPEVRLQDDEYSCTAVQGEGYAQEE